MIKKINELIYANFRRLMNTNELYDDIELIVSNERNIETLKPKKNRIIVVISYFESAITAGQTLMPVQLSILSEYNNIEKTQALLYAYAESYNTKDNADFTIKQFYLTPELVGAFNEYYDGYRGLYTMSGTLLISENMNALTEFAVFDGNKYVALDLISSRINFGIQVSPDTFIDLPTAHTFATALQGTLTVNIVLYQTDNFLFNDILGMIFADLPIDRTYQCRFTYRKVSYSNVNLQLVDYENANELASLPAVSLTFTRAK